MLQCTVARRAVAGCAPWSAAVARLLPADEILEARYLGLRARNLSCVAFMRDLRRPRAPPRSRRSARRGRAFVDEGGDLAILAREALISGLQREGVALRGLPSPRDRGFARLELLVELRDLRLACLELRVDAVPLGLEASHLALELREPEGDLDRFDRSVPLRRALPRCLVND